MIELLFAGVVILGINAAAAVGGYYTALNHVDRLLDIEEGQNDQPFPPGFEETAAADTPADRALSPEQIDEIDDWGEEDE